MSGEQIVSYKNGLTNILNVTYDGRIITLTPEHNEIHEGNMFSIAESRDLANAAVGDFLFVVPAMLPKQPHFVLSVENTAEALYQFYEGSTVSDLGTEISSFNRNRASSSEALLKVYEGSTVTAVGNIILNSKQGINKQIGGSVRSENEMILADDTMYLLRITNLAAGVNTINGLVSWYEHSL